MTNKNAGTCHFCHYYHFLGTRGGHCTELDVEVNGNWRACQFSRCCLEDDAVEAAELAAELNEFTTPIPINPTLPEVEDSAVVRLSPEFSLRAIAKDYWGQAVFD